MRAGPTMRVFGAALLSALVLLASAAGAETIRDFDTTVRLAPATEFEVEERIVWDFGSDRRHGIIRRIPVRYDRGRAADWRVRVDVESVTDGQGNPLRFGSREGGGYVELKIGDPDSWVTGEREYRIRYRVARGLLYFEDHDELYWNATGTEWEVPIESASTTVELPAGASGEGLRTACFAGPRGSSLADCSAEVSGDAVRFAANDTLAPGSGLTVVVGLRKGVLPQPSAAEQALDRASDYVSAWLLLPLLAFVVLHRLWRTQGRDPAGADAIPVRYEPPAGLAPAEVGTVLDERADPADVTATILDLAVRGALRIEEEESKRFLFLTNRDYKLVRTGQDVATKPFERKLLDALFTGRGNEVRVSDLREKFYKHVPGIQSALYAGLSGGPDACFPSSPEAIRKRWRMIAILTLGLAGLVLMAEQSVVAIGSVAATGLLVLAYGQAMPRRTRKGRRARDEILGFQEFVRRVDADRLERSGGRTADRFERVLPYAVVLGVADRWAEAFEGIYVTPPSWYRSDSPGVTFSTDRFVSDLGRSLSTMGQAITSQPASRGSGSSGFSGGSSGGGFGGGGGSSW